MRKKTIQYIDPMTNIIHHKKTTWYLLGFIPVFSSSTKQVK